MTSRQTVLAALLVCSLTLGGCKQFARTMGELLVVRDEVKKKFGDETSINAREFQNKIILSITFVNSSLNDLDHTAREQRAVETAAIVKTHYSQINRVDTIWIGFSREKTRYLVVHSFEMVDLYSFDREGKPVSRTPANSTVGVYTPRIALDTKAVYIDNANQTDISVTGLQLEGAPGDGLTFLPHFTLQGDATKTKAQPPAFVTFDFASYASTAKFQDEVTFRFIVDGKSAVRTVGRFSEMKPPDTTGQFCYLGFPYKAFQRMIAGESLTIMIGDEEFELTEDQFQAMKKMAEYVTP